MQDGRWFGMVMIGYKTDGKPIRKTIYGTSRQEVAKLVVSLTSEVFEGGYIKESAREEHNFKVLFVEWYELFVVSNQASITQEVRRCLINNHIVKVLGGMDVRNIDVPMLQRFLITKQRFYQPTR